MVTRTVPNGFGEAPELDARDASSLGHYLGWMGAVLNHVYYSQEDMLHRLVEFEKQQQEKDARTRFVNQQQEEKKRWWDRTKTRVETVTSVVGGVSIGVSIGVGIAAFIF